jgi:hypothetical protein
MTSNCPLAGDCRRYENDAARHALTRTYADFSEELIRRGNGTVECPFFLAASAPPAA